MAFVSTFSILALVAVSAAPHKTLALTKASEPDGTEYSLSFCARPSPSAALNLPGHAFVGYSMKPRKGARRYLAVGHTTYAPPGAVLLTYLGLRPSVEGSIEEELFTATQEHCLVLLVSKAAYDQAIAAAADVVSGGLPSFTEQRRTILRYTLGAQDCMSFMLGVLKPFAGDRGVRIPARGPTELPLPYLRRLIDAN
ncbi:MAG TPA: hypothetical protein VFZ09_38880 [Archangium sp.]|uniref:hypothetical protein n=1 Tax=Archangium sp. TaxID=1872627 RepID=UPI002E3283D0|nr:hypothetical protein [Archangium sp.]HEX5752243.1 hypothetical protein [Archangium sp.]